MSSLPGFSPVPFVTVVSGLPRSGTSLMMQTLAAGGIPPLTDAERAPDESNPRGYLELEVVKKLRLDKSWLPQARGKAVKIIHLLLPELTGPGVPEGLEFRVVMMRRPGGGGRREPAGDARAAGQGGGGTCPTRNLGKLFTDQLERVERLLAGLPNFQVCSVPYPALVADPAAEAARVNAFLGGGLDEAAMARAVDPALYRERS